MEKKNKFLSKLNIKNYNNQLETILESKIFSLDVKNLLLSMLYKIENAYKDYINVKVEVIPQRDFIEYILEVIKEKCFDIELIKPDSEDKQKVDNEKGKIVCLPNERNLLYSIWKLGETNTEFSSKYEYINSSLQEMINIGSNINAVEVIRDFNGWSWDIVVKEIQDLKYNILYQSLLLLDGKEIVYMNINNEKYDSILDEKNSKEYENFLDLLYINSINMNILVDESKKEKIRQIKSEKNNQLEELKNKKAFVQKITNNKKEYTAKIEEIDRIMNNKDLLREEYETRNEKLPNKEKIFSISHLADKLEKERKEYLSKIKKCNKMLDPKEFVKEKEKIEKEVEFIEKIDLENKNNKEEDIANFCKEFLMCAKKQINKLEERIDIINWFYKIRYYRYIPFNEEIYLKDVKMLEQDFKTVIKLLIKKAQENKIIDIFSEDDELTYIIIKELFDSKMINLETVNITCKYENGILYLEYYDTNILEMKKEFKIDNVKIKKKIKLFI